MAEAQRRSSFWLRLVPQRVYTPADVTVQASPDARHIGTLPGEASAAVIPGSAGAKMGAGAVNVGIRTGSAEIEVKQ